MLPDQVNEKDVRNLFHHGYFGYVEGKELDDDEYVAAFALSEKAEVSRQQLNYLSSNSYASAMAAVNPDDVLIKNGARDGALVFRRVDNKLQKNCSAAKQKKKTDESLESAGGVATTTMRTKADTYDPIAAVMSAAHPAVRAPRNHDERPCLMRAPSHLLRE